MSVEDAIQWSNWYGGYFNAEYFLEDMTTEWGYTDYNAFMEFVVQEIHAFASELETLDSASPTQEIRLTSTTGNTSTIRTIDQTILNSQISKNKAYAGTTKKSTITPQRVFDGVDLVFNVIVFALNAIAQNTADTEAGRTLGTILSFILTSAGGDPGQEAIMKNFAALHKSVEQVQAHLNTMHSELNIQMTQLQAMLREGHADTAINNINTWYGSPGEEDTHYEGASGLLRYMRLNHNTLTPEQRTSITNWCNSVIHNETGAPNDLTALHNTIVGNATAGKSLFSFWKELAKAQTNPTNRADFENLLYLTVRKSFTWLVFWQTAGTTCLVEAYKARGEPENQRSAIVRLRDRLKEQVKLYESMIEELALQGTWRLYSRGGVSESTSNQACPNFPMGLVGGDGFLSDVDTFVQKYVYADEQEYTDNGTTKKRLVARDMLTVRIVAPYNSGGETVGLVGFGSSRYWKLYDDPIMRDKPTVPTDPPGTSTETLQFAYNCIKILPYLDNSNVNKTPSREIDGRNPFETRNTALKDQLSWKYTLHKMRRVFDLDHGAPPDLSKEFNVSLETGLSRSDGHDDQWHPNLTRGQWPTADGAWNSTLPNLKVRKGKTKVCESYGFYGLKGPQYVRLMAYHENRPLSDWWFSGWKSQDSQWLFANRADAYTFYQLWPLGNAWYALRDSVGTNWSNKDNGIPIAYLGRDNYSLPVQKWIGVNPDRNWHGSTNLIFADQAYIGPRCTFKVKFEKKFEPEVAPTPIPGMKSYTMKTWADGDKGSYLKWHYETAQWDRYHADGSDDDATKKDCWVRHHARVFQNGRLPSQLPKVMFRTVLMLKNRCTEF